ncbi:MAG: TonB-dependent receptor [Desulfobacterales bacterium]|nr:TonB-dependent receptor [Desulfobacterales bacterium]
MIFSVCRICEAQIEDEMQILRLFYKEQDLVISPTRHPKPISQVAENITVITAEEIKKMNTHTIAEALNRIVGTFIISTQDFGAPSQFMLQGSEDRHILVLIDGVPLNFLSEGAAETSYIPLGIISRIEVIKGPASSAWGSSLGGVINIITKSAGNTEIPKASVSASYGEKNTQDYRAEMAGELKSVGYYLYTGYQDSDGLRFSRNHKNNSFYSKIRIPFSTDLVAGLSVGYNESNTNFGDFPSAYISSAGDSRILFITGSLNATLSKNLRAHISLYTLKQKFVQNKDNLGLGSILGNDFADGELFSKNIYDEKTIGTNAKLVWAHRRHTAVLGADFNYGELSQKSKFGNFPIYLLGRNEISEDDTGVDKWAIYFNDTITVQNWSITPGIRFDKSDITESFVSPSLGVTYKLSDDSILKASVARGFNIPCLSMNLVNPDLEPEKVWSYQTGIESSASKYFWVKATGFYHELKDAIGFSVEGIPANDYKKTIERKGFEIETETMSFYNLSLSAGIAYVKIEPYNTLGSNEIYIYNIGVKYDDKKSFNARLFGHYIEWDLGPELDSIYHSDSSDFVWDLTFNKKIHQSKKSIIETFFSAHNIFNGSQYIYEENQNPRRWIEAGFKITF